MTQLAPLTILSEKDGNGNLASVPWLHKRIPWGAFTYADVLVLTLDILV